jgi:glycerate-2-kinase
MTRKRFEQQRIIDAAQAAVEPGRCVRQALRLAGDRLEIGDREYDLAGFSRILVAGVGKSAAAMADGFED